MRTNQKGFTALETILIIALVGVLGFVGWYVYQSNQSDDQSEETAASEQAEKDTEEIATLQPGELLELNPAVRLSTPEDVDDLPEKTPESFKEYMRDELRDFDGNYQAPEADVECEQYFEVDLISSTNIRTQSRAVEAGTNEAGMCAIGGAQLIRYLADAQTGQWDDLVIVHAPPACEQLITKQIYEEFFDICLESSDDSPSDAVPNPNGSILQRAN